MKNTYTLAYYYAYMLKQNHESPRLTENDKAVLRRIIDHAKVPDSTIAQSIGISPQAVFKIRGKLEKLGIIKGYVPILDFKKIGIHVMSLLIIRLTEEAWGKYTDYIINERIAHMPYVIEAFRVTDVRASHILLMGFRDLYQKEKYISDLQTKFARQIEIINVYTFSVDKVIVQNPLGILYEIIDKKDFSPYEFFSDRKQ